jgi:hypothetical protein
LHNGYRMLILLFLLLCDNSTLIWQTTNHEHGTSICSLCIHITACALVSHRVWDIKSHDRCSFWTKSFNCASDMLGLVLVLLLLPISDSGSGAQLYKRQHFPMLSNNRYSSRSHQHKIDL